MAFANADLVLLAHGNGKKLYYHDASASSDAIATVRAAGYYNNSDDSLNLAAKDMILVNASDGEVLLEVASISSGSVTTTVSSMTPFGLIETASTAAALSNIGLSRLTATASKTYSLSAPFAGALKMLHKSAASTKIISVNAGSGVTFDGSNDDMTFNGADDAAILLGVSATRWVILARNSIALS